MVSLTRAVPFVYSLSLQRTSRNSINSLPLYQPLSCGSFRRPTTCDMAEKATPILTVPAFLQRFLFRFLVVYLVIYCFPFPLDAFDFTAPVAHPYYTALDYLMEQAGKWVFHVHVAVAFPGFDKVDDSGYGLVFLYCNLVLSFVLALAWTFWKPQNTSAKFHEWLKLYLRFFLAAYLLGYGFDKLFPSQFQPLTASRLALTVGEQSPMLLAWNFMGYSTVFTGIMGAVEIIAGLLLLFRRTATLASLLSIGTFGFIALLDFCFNVPVRLLVTHLLLISVFIVAEDYTRLLHFFVLNRPVEAATYNRFFVHTTRRIAFTALQIVVAFCLVYKAGSDALVAAKTFGIYMPKPPLYGVYRTDYFIRDGDTVAPLQTDTLRWKQLVIDGGSWKQNGLIEFNSDIKIACVIAIDTIKRTMTIQHLEDTTRKFHFVYTRPDSTHLFLRGRGDKDSIEVLMHQYSLDNFLLQKEKFRPISAD
jgi:hypothetical protein